MGSFERESAPSFGRSTCPSLEWIGASETAHEVREDRAHVGELEGAEPPRTQVRGLPTAGQERWSGADGRERLTPRKVNRGAQPRAKRIAGALIVRAHARPTKRSGTDRRRVEDEARPCTADAASNHQGRREDAGRQALAGARGDERSETRPYAVEDERRSASGNTAPLRRQRLRTILDGLRRARAWLDCRGAPHRGTLGSVHGSSPLRADDGRPELSLRGAAQRRTCGVIRSACSRRAR